MTKRKDLKKYVRDVTGNLYADCIATKLYVGSVNPVLADEIANDILMTAAEFVCRINHTEPGNVKGFYKKFNEDFNRKTCEIVDAIDKLA